MAQATYTEVVKLAEQLSLSEQQALITHLLELAKHRELSSDERKRLFESIIVDIPPGEAFSLNREDWYKKIPPSD